MEGEAGAQLLLWHEVRPWKRGLGSFQAGRPTLAEEGINLLNPEGRELAIGNRRPGRVGLRGSEKRIFATPLGPSRPPPKAASPVPSNPQWRHWKSSTKIIKYGSYSATYLPSDRKGLVER